MANPESIKQGTAFLVLPSLAIIHNRHSIIIFNSVFKSLKVQNGFTFKSSLVRLTFSEHLFFK